ncbi:hypothetical protein ACFVZC_32200 [Streptomyces marokkonensis]|uniref:Uncharacterized protein n=1 Tax=Streptomyces marokkonensis TaxID=324855 RepID=A0ABW6QFV2_9ACTN
MLAFTKLIEARAHARENDPRAASKALKTSEDLLEQAKDDSGDGPAWIDFYQHARLSADAAKIFRDLKNLKMALGWDQQAVVMPAGVFTRSVGMRLAIVGTSHLQDRNFDRGLELGNRSVDILARVQSSRAKDYVREFNTALTPGGASPPSVTSSTAPAKNSASPRDSLLSSFTGWAVRDEVVGDRLVLAVELPEDEDGCRESHLLSSTPGLDLGRPGVLESSFQADNLVAQPPFDFRRLVRLRTHRRVELLLDVGMALLQSHAVNTGLCGERNHREAAVGAGGLAGQEAVHGRAGCGSARFRAAGSCDGLLGGLGGGVVGLGESAEAVGGQAKPVAQWLGHQGCLRIEPVSVLSCRLRVTVGADCVAAAELTGEPVGCRRPWDSGRTGGRSARPHRCIPPARRCRCPRSSERDVRSWGSAPATGRREPRFRTAP